MWKSLDNKYFRKFSFFMRNKKGFTLIELLVVIAIIGLLSSLAMVNLNSARAKARDARRLSDIKQLSTILEIQATEGTVAAYLETCSGEADKTYLCDGPGLVVQFTYFRDPSNAEGDACLTDSDTTCSYSISTQSGESDATVEDYEICFFLEQGAGSFSARGVYAIEAGSRFGDCDADGL